MPSVVVGVSWISASLRRRARFERCTCNGDRAFANGVIERPWFVLEELAFDFSEAHMVPGTPHVNAQPIETFSRWRAKASAGAWHP